MIANMENGGGLIETQPENHKGDWCILNPKKFCQESGGCGDCEIARRLVERKFLEHFELRG